SLLASVATRQPRRRTTMMARQHVALGFAGYMTTVSTLGGTNPLWPDAPRVEWLESAAQPLALLIGAVIAAACAIFSPVVRLFCFGHRGLSHTWVFALASGLGIWFLSQVLNNFWGPIATKVLLAVVVAVSALLITKLLLPGNIGKKSGLAMVLAVALAATSA